jgi:hypothetical protein
VTKTHSLGIVFLLFSPRTPAPIQTRNRGVTIHHQTFQVSPRSFDITRSAGGVDDFWLKAIHTQTRMARLCCTIIEHNKSLSATVVDLPITSSSHIVLLGCSWGGAPATVGNRFSYRQPVAHPTPPPRPKWPKLHVILST